MLQSLCLHLRSGQNLKDESFISQNLHPWWNSYLDILPPVATQTELGAVSTIASHKAPSWTSAADIGEWAVFFGNDDNITTLSPHTAILGQSLATWPTPGIDSERINKRFLFVGNILCFVSLSCSCSSKWSHQPSLKHGKNWTLHYSLYLSVSYSHFSCSCGLLVLLRHIHKINTHKSEAHTGVRYELSVYFKSFNEDDWAILWSGDTQVVTEISSGYC